MARINLLPWREQLREELKRLGNSKPLPAIRKSKKRPSIECRILNFK